MYVANDILRRYTLEKNEETKRINNTETQRMDIAETQIMDNTEKK